MSSVVQPEINFKFDVALSFVQQDEYIAQELHDLLRDRYSVFLYSERQEELAGRDGEQRFNEVFGQEARIVIILYRPEWGETRWTRIEQTAIRNRAFEEGYDFALFVPMERSLSLPPWVPRARIWFNLNRWGVTGCAPIIEALIQQRGGEASVESVSDRTARLQRSLAAERARQEFLRNIEGVSVASAHFDSILEAIHQWGASEFARTFGVQELTMGRALMFYGSPAPPLTVIWDCPYANEVEKARLRVSHWRGVPRWPGLVTWEEAREIQKRSFLCDLDGAGRFFWREDGTETPQYTSETLADEILRSYMDVIQKNAVKHR
jgi:hypothetical protein